MASWILVFIISYSNMHSNSQEKSSVQQDSKGVSNILEALQNMIEKQRRGHLREIKAINQSIEDCAAQRKQECMQYEVEITRLNGKIVSLKQKYAKICERNKELSDNVKQMMDKKISLEKEIISNRSQLAREREKKHEQSKYIAELKHVVDLQEIQNGELKKQCQTLNQKIVYLKSEIQEFSQIKDKFANIDSIAQKQYQTQINLLKEQLQLEFKASTQNIFETINHRSQILCFQATEKEDFDMQNKGTKTFKQSINNRQTQTYLNQINLLAHYTQYGQTYFQVKNQELKLSQSQIIYSFISQLVKRKNHLVLQIQQQKKLYLQLKESCQQRVQIISSQIQNIRSRSFTDQFSQTASFDRIQEVVNINTSLKLKIYETQKIMQIMSHFAIYLTQILQIRNKKQPYYLFAQKIMFKSLNSKKSKLKSNALSVFFIQIMKKQSRKRKRHHGDANTIVSKNYTNNMSLAHLIQLFFMKRNCSKINKNYKIQQIFKQKIIRETNQKFMMILDQQSLNQAHFCDFYQPSISKFINQIQLRNLLIEKQNKNLQN